MAAIKRNLELLRENPDLDGPTDELLEVVRQIEQSLAGLDPKPVG